MAATTRVCALRSGSSGNAIFVASGQTRLLIDAGVPGRDVEQALQEIGEDPRQLSGILVTHEHSDHVSGVGVLMRRYHLPLYTNRATWLAMRNTLGKIDETCVHAIETGRPFEVGDLAVSGFATSHDAAESLAFRIETGHGAVTVCTDLGWPEPTLLASIAGSRLIFIEANYDPAMLAAGHYPPHLKRRIAGDHGHLSNDDSARTIMHLLQRGTEQFVLSHLSRENNYPELAYLTVRNHLQEQGARIDHDLQVTLARRYEVSQPIDLTR
jgi:phosphoribosyl 1,2-cyclic phosphodiesterase